MRAAVRAARMRGMHTQVVLLHREFGEQSGIESLLSSALDAAKEGSQHELAMTLLNDLRKIELKACV